LGKWKGGNLSYNLYSLVVYFLEWRENITLTTVIS